MLFAALVGVITAFSLTHNPVFMVCTGPLVALTGPFIGGMVAAGRAKTGPREALLYALCIALVNTAPLIVAWLWLAHNTVVLFGPFVLNRPEVAVLGWVTAGFAAYMLMTAFAGAMYGARREARKRAHAEGQPLASA
ncbi:MAG: hypothetical protein RMM58_15030 [Chloroflexota bacterium]|nr:hypothetical protein [Dehalococcoidia bacterium]MDW8255188.1 hypothetical protein [Chloroflexota bacterium]